MNFVREVVPEAAIGVDVVDTLEGLSAIHHPGCAAAIWRRPARPDFQFWLDELEPTQLPCARVILSPEAVHDTVVEICEASGIPSSVKRNCFVEDVGVLANIFASLMHTKWLRLRLDVLKTNACRKFHVDTVTARLACTYRGAGTQYGISIDGTGPKHIFSVPTGAPILLRGTLWPESPRSGLLHRSPPIEGTEETRLLLVLDPVRDPDGER